MKTPLTSLVNAAGWVTAAFLFAGLVVFCFGRAMLRGPGWRARGANALSDIIFSGWGPHWSFR